MHPSTLVGGQLRGHERIQCTTEGEQEWRRLRSGLLAFGDASRPYPRLCGKELIGFHFLGIRPKSRYFKRLVMLAPPALRSILFFFSPNSWVQRLKEANRLSTM